MDCIPCKTTCPFCGHQWIKRKLNPLKCHLWTQVKKAKKVAIEGNLVRRK